MLHAIRSTLYYMKTKTTVILLILALALGIYIFFIETKLPTTDEIEQARGKLFPQLKSEDINRLEINAPNGSQMTLGVMTPTTPTRISIICSRHPVSGWEMLQPLKTRADANVLDSVCRNLSDLEKKDTLKEIANLAPYGLKEPLITVNFVTKDNKSYTIRLGKLAPMDLGVYLMIEGNKEVYVVQRFIAESVNRPVSDFRYKQIFDTNIYDVTTLRFIYPDLSAVPMGSGQAGATLELQKKADDWFITKPVAEEKADANKTKDMLSTLSTLSIFTFVADYETDLKRYGLDKPKMKLVVVDPKDPAKSETLLLGEEKEKDKFLAVKEGTKTVFTIEKSNYDKIVPLIEDFRVRKFIELVSKQIDKIQVRYKNADVLCIEKNKPAEGGSASGGRWQWVYPTMTTTGNTPYDVDSFLDRLNNSNIEKFVADTATDLTPYGLNEPFSGMELYFRMGYLSPTSETRILVGVVSGTPYAYLKEPNKPKVVAVSNSLWDYLKQGTLNLRKKSLMDIDSGKVKKLTLSVLGKEPLVYEQSESQTWKMMAPKAPQTEAEKNPDLTGLMMEMCHLTASEFVADLNVTPDLTPYGLDNPEMTIVMEYGDKDKPATIKTLQIGKKAETHYYARFAGDVIVFKMTPSPVETITKLYSPR